jgi:hypothetical protein
MGEFGDLKAIVGEIGIFKFCQGAVFVELLLKTSDVRAISIPASFFLDIRGVSKCGRGLRTAFMGFDEGTIFLLCFEKPHAANEFTCFLFGDTGAEVSRRRRCDVWACIREGLGFAWYGGSSRLRGHDARGSLASHPAFGIVISLRLFSLAVGVGSGPPHTILVPRRGDRGERAIVLDTRTECFRGLGWRVLVGFRDTSIAVGTACGGITRWGLNHAAATCDFLEVRPLVPHRFALENPLILDVPACRDLFPLFYLIRHSDSVITDDLTRTFGAGHDEGVRSSCRSLDLEGQRCRPGYGP